jgi:two-component system, LytTR family, sensor kinase
MQNPILGNKKSLLKYFLIWMFFGLVFFLVMSNLINTDKKILATDFILQNFIMACLLIGLWYPINFMSWENQKLGFLILNHLLLFLIFAFTWVSSVHFFLKLIFDTQSIDSYIENAFAYKIPFCFFAYIVFVISTYLLKYYDSFLEKKEIESRLSDSIKEAELTLLRNQMNPHFIFNSLNSISSLTIVDPEKAHDMVIKLSDFLRYTVGYGQNQTVSLFKELEMCRAYLDIEKIRFGDKIEVLFEIGENTEQIEVPSMLLQTLFENAIKHGIYNSLDPEKIEFSSKLIQDRLELKIENTFDINGNNSVGTKTGLKNIKERLRLIYQNLAIFETKAVENKFLVLINLPIKYENKNFTY